MIACWTAKSSFRIACAFSIDDGALRLMFTGGYLSVAAGFLIDQMPAEPDAFVVKASVFASTL